jgi:hypothetical protein
MPAPRETLMRAFVLSFLVATTAVMVGCGDDAASAASVSVDPSINYLDAKAKVAIPKIPDGKPRDKEELIKEIKDKLDNPKEYEAWLANQDAWADLSELCKNPRKREYAIEYLETSNFKRPFIYMPIVPQMSKEEMKHEFIIRSLIISLDNIERDRKDGWDYKYKVPTPLIEKFLRMTVDIHGVESLSVAHFKELKYSVKIVEYILQKGFKISRSDLDSKYRMHPDSKVTDFLKKMEAEGMIPNATDAETESGYYKAAE